MSKRKRNGHHNDEIEQLTRALARNGAAIAEGPRRKKWTLHDLKTIKPLTVAQEEMFHDWFAGQNIIAAGSAGTGKTFIALYLALNEILHSEAPQKRIVIVRSAVPTREVGFIPGTLEEKIALYELPYHEIFHQLLGRYSSYEDMKRAGFVEFITTSYIRGLTWDNSIVIVDEGQNMNWHEVNSVMTRVGENTRIIFTGDLPQSDLIKSSRDSTGMSRLVKVAREMPKSFTVVTFTPHDIVRSEFVKQWIVASENVPS